MNKSKIVEIIFHNGQPDGIRRIRKNNSTITTYVVPRPLLSEAKTLTGVNNPGIYYLISESDDNSIAQIYIGQTSKGISRLDDHNRSKDFWNKAILFLADSKTFTLDMISGLEKYAIQKAMESKRYKVENSVVPKYEIDEYAMVSVEENYDEIQFIMGTQGYKMDDAKVSSNQANILHTTRNGIEAFGVYDGEKFEVLEGSQINIGKEAKLERYNKQRADLLKNGSISQVDGKYILNIILDFNTPSGASDFVLGGSTNGWTEWKDKDGKTLDQIYRKQSQ